nr:EOG090X01B4 [Cyclestheria hislopi]
MATAVGTDGRTQYVYTISGIRVEFPVKAYPSQIAMMDKVIRGLQRGQHCLLESPTGSGKTLALLCASLAWQKAEAENVRKHNEAVDSTLRNGSASFSDHTKTVSKVEKKEAEVITIDDDDFQPSLKRTKVNVSPPVNDVMDVEPFVDNDVVHLRKQKVPKIYFGTRTHKQIAQVVKEFRRTAYNKTPMCVLASREHTCIHPDVSRSSNKNEGCKELTDIRQLRKGGGCAYYLRANSKLRTHGTMQSYGYETGWDIEDLVRLGRKLRACPYYASRQLMEGASIVFSPYNYLIDPRIRQSMDIQMKGNVIVLDEAHNIEDSAREAASASFSQEDFRLAMDDCEKVASRNAALGSQIGQLAAFCSYMLKWIDRQATSMKSVGIDREVHTMTGTEFLATFIHDGYGPEKLAEIKTIVDFVFNEQIESEWMIGQLAAFCSYMLKWIDRQATSMKSVGIDREVHTMTGTEFLATFIHDGYGPEKLAEIKTIVDFVFNEQIESEWMDDEQKADPQLSGATHLILEGFFVIMEFLLEDNQIHRDDYRAAIVRTVERRRNADLSKGWFSKADMTSKWCYTLNLWCLNPAVVLKNVRELTRTVIVTSGTLSPLASYQSELNIDFKITLEAAHVIPANRVWVGSISHGPKNILLNGTFRSTGTFDYQDELGRLILGVCRTVPHGILCFLSSYSLLEKLTTRWQNTGLWEQFLDVKTIVCESRESGEFEETLKSFYQAIRSSESSSSTAENGPTGALMLAVCRGKVSEGLDFANNNARAVICVGIPFPNFKDTQVELKREYNDKKPTTSKLLNGSEWYEIQAFRALNQALGRCIRHKNDWGAILLVDDRFSKIPRYSNGLSKWVRSSIRHYNNYKDMMQSMSQFTETLMAEEAEQLLPTISSTEPVVSSPYFSSSIMTDSPANIGLGKLNFKSEDQISSESSLESIDSCTTPIEISSSESDEAMKTPKTKRRTFATLLGHSKKCRLPNPSPSSKQSSRYFESKAE